MINQDKKQEVCGVSMKIGYATSEDGSITVSQFGTCLGKKGNCSLHDSPTPKKEKCACGNNITGTSTGKCEECIFIRKTSFGSPTFQKETTYLYQQLSNCCESPMMTSTGDEGTGCNICRACKKACDPKKEVVPDSDLCVMCYAYGEDKRHLRMRCMYAIDEVVPEMIFNKENKMYEAWICKSCRGSLLSKMKEWRLERVELRDKTKDHDGYLEEDEDPTRDIPVRINGAIVMMNEEEYEKYKRQNRK